MTNYNLEIRLVKKVATVKRTHVLKTQPKVDNFNKTIETSAPLNSEKKTNSTRPRFTVSKTRRSSLSSSPSPPPHSRKQTTPLSPERLNPISTSQIKKLFSENLNYGLTGLANLGNTCYMNAAIQFLVNVTDLRDYFMGKYYASHLKYESKILVEKI